MAAKTSLPPGFRFHPTDVELIKYYLKRKVMGRKLQFNAIAEVDIYKYAPWDLPDKSCLKGGDLKWYFFCPREKKYANGARMNRATEFGYWKTTGKDRPVHCSNEVVGMIKTLVFHRGKAPKGDRTDWVMHEYRIEEKGLADRGVAQDAYVLCIVFQKDGPGPRNGAQYGAPFREEDWDDDDEVGADAILSTPVPNQTCPIAASAQVPESPCIGISESCLSDAIPSAASPLAITNGVPMEAVQATGDDELLAMLAFFTDDDSLIPNEGGLNENLDNNHAENAEAQPGLDGIDIFNGLGDLGNSVRLGGVGYEFFNVGNTDYNPNQWPLGGDMPFLELFDLDAPLNRPAETRESIPIHDANVLHTDQKHSAARLCHPVNTWLSQTPTMAPEGPYRVEGQLENVVCGNTNQACLGHGGTAVFRQFAPGCSNPSEDPRRGFRYPR